MNERLTILQGDALVVLNGLPDESVQCCVTSPPYWGLRDYGVEGQLGLERTPEEYVAKMVAVFSEVRRVLREDGTLWLNIGDSYSSGGRDSHGNRVGYKQSTNRGTMEATGTRLPMPEGCKPKDLVGIPWMLAFALRADGWWLRQDIIWHKPNPMPESVTDRCTKSHEYLFLLTKSARYFYDAEAIKEPLATEPHAPGNKFNEAMVAGPNDRNGHSQWETSMDKVWGESGTRNKRSVWTVPSNPYSEAHFATFPPDLIKPCILAGTSARGCCPKCGAPWERVVESEANGVPQYNEKTVGQPHHHSDQHTLRAQERTCKTTGWQPTCECSGQWSEHSEPLKNGEDGTRSFWRYDGGALDPVPCTVLDCFGGSGTSGMVALELGRKAILIELNPAYVKLIERRCDVTPGLALA